jgi:hypothetical protein
MEYNSKDAETFRREEAEKRRELHATPDLDLNRFQLNAAGPTEVSNQEKERRVNAVKEMRKEMEESRNRTNNSYVYCWVLVCLAFLYLQQ